MSASITWTLEELKTKELSGERLIDPDTELLRKVWAHLDKVGHSFPDYKAVPGKPYLSVETDSWFISLSNIKPLLDVVMNMIRFAMIQPSVITELLSRLATITEADKTELSLWLQSRVIGYTLAEIQELLDVNNTKPRAYYLLSGKEVYKKLGYKVKDGSRDYDKLLRAYTDTQTKITSTNGTGYLDRLRLRRLS